MMLQGTAYTQISSTGGKNTHHGESRTLFYAQCFAITCVLSYLLFTYHHYLSNFTCWTSDGTVLVTGATGRTGSFLYHELKRRGVSDLRAFVRNADKAREVLGCIACDETEGIYVGDVTQPQDLKRAMAGVKTLAIAVGAGARSSPDVQRQVEFNSVVYSIEALANGGGSRPLSVVLCSSMGTNITPQPSWAGDILFWKLNAEAFLSSSAIGRTVIVKPCGLKEGMAGKNSTLLVGHNGTITETSDYHTVSREDVASVMAEAVLMPYDSSRSTNLRFDFCSEPGPATKDLKNLIENARYEWDK
eukprot:CAMPEP_0178926264 /NCGR_PEP_ID=MMETSP0786-20121207/18426_1 /TAXON_ID=186022 /ORGANISM="Thalassionema frauenfeldii, Strain CCMP 1798" /LENGTH=302 /DNA_ID=CAMNT_0020601347 /DNA_START=58 /DNA_END=966 /DNA_ORIENTATION=+